MNQKVLHARADEVKLEGFEMPADTVIDGNPNPSLAVMWRSDDRRKVMGIYECTPGKFRYVMPADEMAYILKGRARCTPEGGESFELTPGDVVVFSSGQVCEWEITETFRDVWQLTSDKPIEL